VEDARPQAPAKQSVGGGFFCWYLLRSLCLRLKGRTYIGFTVNPGAANPAAQR
jgi:structure-specific endonuclease subunit SLX1